MVKMKESINIVIDEIPRVRSVAERATTWIGSTTSLIVHTALFCASFVFIMLGASSSTVMLVLTTAVSLEAIYLSIFIQMSVNRHTESLAGVEEDIDSIHAEVREIGDDVDEISEDIDEISKDIDEISDDIDDIQEHDEKEEKPSLEKIEDMLRMAIVDLERLKARG